MKRTLQRDLFAAFAALGAHASDPAPAREAARRVTASGARASHAAIVLELVRAHPLLTAAEIGERSRLGHVEAQRRLSDLKNAGLVVVDGRGEYQGRAMSIWRLA